MKTNPDYLRWSLWEMSVIAKSNRLQRFFLKSFIGGKGMGRIKKKLHVVYIDTLSIKRNL